MGLRGAIVGIVGAMGRSGWLVGKVRGQRVGPVDRVGKEFEGS